MGVVAKSAAEKDKSKQAAHVSPSRYILIWIVLLVMTGLTLLLSKVHLGALNVAVALAIATFKSLLVILFFMHLWEHGGANRLVFAVSGLFVALLILLTVADAETRFTPALPQSDPRAMQGDVVPEPGSEQGHGALPPAPQH